MFLFSVILRNTYPFTSRESRFVFMLVNVNDKEEVESSYPTHMLMHILTQACMHINTAHSSYLTLLGRSK